MGRKAVLRMKSGHCFLLRLPSSTYCVRCSEPQVCLPPSSGSRGGSRLVCCLRQVPRPLWALSAHL